MWSPDWRWSFSVNHSYIFSCLTAVSKQLHATWLHLVLVSRYLISWQVEYEKWTTFLSFCPRNSRFEYFSWTKFCVIWLAVTNVNVVGLKPTCWFPDVFGVFVLLEHPPQGSFFYIIRQHDFLNAFKLSHDPCQAHLSCRKNRFDMLCYEKYPCMVTQFQQFTEYCDLNSVFMIVWQSVCGSRLKTKKE